MKVLFLIPKNNPPTLEGNYSKPLKEFVEACLNKEASFVSVKKKKVHFLSLSCIFKLENEKKKRKSTLLIAQFFFFLCFLYRGQLPKSC